MKRDENQNVEYKESGHDNPGMIEFPEEEQFAANVSFGAFKLSEKQIGNVANEAGDQIKKVFGNFPKLW